MRILHNWPLGMILFGMCIIYIFVFRALLRARYMAGHVIWLASRYARARSRSAELVRNAKVRNATELSFCFSAGSNCDHSPLSPRYVLLCMCVVYIYHRKIVRVYNTPRLPIEYVRSHV